SSRSWRRFRHQLVVEVAATGIGRDDLHLAPGCVPAVAAELARARARRVVLAEDAQARDAVDERELSDHADRAERPGRRVAEDARRKARLDALVVAAVAVGEEAVRRVRGELDGERAVPGRVSRPGGGDRVAPDDVAAEDAAYGANVDHGCPRRRA